MNHLKYFQQSTFKNEEVIVCKIHVNKLLIRAYFVETVQSKVIVFDDLCNKVVKTVQKLKNVGGFD